MKMLSKVIQKKTLLMTDCIGISCILRSKATNEKMLEYALYISTFKDLHVKYTVGSSLFLADLITRQYNKIELDNDNEQISAVWSHFSPPLKKKYVGSTLTPAMLTDLFIKSPSAEYIDCFNKRAWYDQSLSRYHTKDDSPITSNDAIPVELDFLASLYSGFNGTKMSAEQFQELESSLRNVPAHCLAKSSHGNLNELRKTLFKLNIHKDLIEVLKRKYFPDQYFEKNVIKVADTLTDLDMPTEVARIIRDAWRKAGVNPETAKTTQLTRKTQVHGRESTEHVPPSSSWKVTADTIILESGCTDEQTLSDFLDKFLDNQHSETDLLRVFNLNETKLREVLQPAARIFLQMNYFFKTGRILTDKNSAIVLRNDMPHIDLDAIFNDKPVALKVLLKLLVNIIDHLSQHQYFLFKDVLRIPYNFEGMNHFELKYNFGETAFEIYALKDICLENYQSVKYEFKFAFVVNQLVCFEQNKNLSVLAIDCAQPIPPYFEFIELIFHSLIRESFVIQAGTKLGQWKILSLQSKCR